MYKTREDICPQWSITHRSRISGLRSCPALSLQMHRAEMVMCNPALPPPHCRPHLQSAMAPFAHGLLLLVQTFEFLPQWTPCRLPHPFLCALMLPGAAPEQQRGACHCLGQKLVLHVSMKPVMENTSLCRQRVSETLSGAVLRDCRLILHPDQMLLQTASAQALVM